MNLLDIVLHLDVHLLKMVAQYGVSIYAILFAIIFCETGLVVTPFLPGDSLLFVAGTVWAASGMSAHPLALTIVAAAFCGDNLNYAIGRFVGARLLQRIDRRWLNRGALERTEAFYRRHGGKTVIMARFVPLVRTFAPFVAGIGRMHYLRYIAFSILASRSLEDPLRLAAVVQIHGVHRRHLTVQQACGTICLQKEPVVIEIFVIEEIAIGALIVQPHAQKDIAAP